MYTPQDEQHLFEQAKHLLKTLPDAPQTAAEQLREVVGYADWKYYVQSEPVLADAEYDALYKKLIHIEAQYPECVTTDSPTQRVAKGISERFPTVPHLVPMLSLDNTYNADDLNDWDARCRELANGAHLQYCVEPKYDGASISLIYENGKLVRGATRGDGIMGEDVTANIRQIKAIPLAAKLTDNGVQQIELRGEIVIHKDVFTAYNKQRVAEGLSPLANPRNAASGTLRILDPAEVRKRGLNAILYHLADATIGPGHDRPSALSTHKGTLEWLYSLGFPTPAREMQLFESIDQVIEFCHQFEKRRDDLAFEVDGLVIKVNDIALQEQMGMTSHHPRWAVAYKFKARQGTSVLRKVEFQVGRTGAITPVAKIDPVGIGGVTVSSISLFNEDVVREKDLRIGDTVLVERAGDVIPYIVKPLTELRKGDEVPIMFPEKCPVCSSVLEKQPGEAAWRCVNYSCPVQVSERIIHYASKDAMDIRNMGAANVQKFCELGWVTDIPSLYHLDWDRVRQLEGFGERSVTNLQQALQQSKNQPLHRLIFGMGIRYVGETTAKTLANAVAHLTDFYNWTEEQYLALDDVGPKVAHAVFEFFASPANRDMIAALAAEGLNLANEHKEQAGGTGSLAGKTFLFTGTLSQMKRSEAEALAEQKGGVILNSVSTKLNYLVVGEDAGSKLEKAKKLGSVAILSEGEFLELVKGE